MLPLQQTSLALLCGATLIAATSLSAGPRFASGDVTFSGTVALTDSDRVSPISTAGSDTIIAFTPAINYKRESNRMNMEANLSFPMQRYDKSDYLDSESISFDMSGEIPFGSGPKLSGSWSMSYFDGTQQNFDTNQNTDSENISFNLNTDYVIQRKLSFRARASHAERDSDGLESSFSSSNTTTLFAAGLHAHDLIRGRVGLYGEYRIQDRETRGGPINETDDGLNFGISGEILRNLKGDVSIGFMSTDRTQVLVGSQPSEDSTTLNAKLDYVLNSKTNLGLNYRQNLEVTDSNETVERGETSLSLQYTPRQRLSFSGSIGVEKNEYIYQINPRVDDVVIGSLSAQYTIRSNWYASLNYNYRDSDSTYILSDYDSSQLTLSSTISY